MIYCDTSYLVRLYLSESGHTEVRKLCAGHEVASAVHALAELPAALHRAFREGRLPPASFTEALEQFAEDKAAHSFHWLPLHEALVDGMAFHFAKFPATTFLRAADALHLACAAAHDFKEVYSNDRHFLAAAGLFGLEGKNIIPH